MDCKDIIIGKGSIEGWVFEGMDSKILRYNRAFGSLDFTTSSTVFLANSRKNTKNSVYFDSEAISG